MKFHLSMSLAVTFLASQLSAHEVWIEADTWVLPETGKISAHVRNGERFEGYDFIWDERNIARAEIWKENEKRDISGRLGDRPALNVIAEEGLSTLLYQSNHSSLEYESFEKFAGFLEEKGYEKILNQHAERQVSETRVREAYVRFSKSLVSVGDGEGFDAYRGMELELVALTNPYTSSGNEPMTVQLYYQNKPLPGNRITVFEKSENGDVTEILLETDSEGKASFTMKEDMTYLVDSVLVREPSRNLVIETGGAVWESLWASLTFNVTKNQ